MFKPLMNIYVNFQDFYSPRNNWDRSERLLKKIFRFVKFALLEQY